MEVDIIPTIIQNTATKLQQRNAFTCGFVDVIGDYQILLRKCRESKIRNVQLEKEARELRAENATLQQLVESSVQAAVSNEKVTAAESRAKELQEELTGVYKEKSKLAEELVAASRQLQIVRDSNEAQARELDDLAAKGREMRARIKELSDALEKEQDATRLAASEMQARLDEKEAAEKRAEKLEKETADLSKRLVDLKMSEAERMNEVNRMCEEMLANARNMERAAAATAASSSARVGRFHSMPAGGLTGMVNGIMEKTKGALTHGAIESLVPDVPMRSVPAHEGGCYTLAFDRSGQRMASGGADKVVRLWDACSGYQTGSLAGMTETVTEVAFTCDQKHLLASGADKALRMWDLGSGRVRHTLTGHSQKVCSVDCSPLEPNRAVSAGTDRCIKVWDLGRGFCASTLICHSSVNSVRLTMDGFAVVSGHFDGALRFWDLRSGKLANEVAGLHTQQITSVSIGLRTGAVLTCGKDNAVKVTDARSFQVQPAMSAPGFAVGGVWSKACLGPDERHCAAGSSTGSLFIWATENGKLVRTLREHGSAQIVQAACWSPQGTPLVSANKDGVVTFWQPSPDDNSSQQQHHHHHGSRHTH
ncbi:Autophagy-related protein 16-1 [Coccomyxa sp. Obi]|nr:Autophagy-related protein 16-1 [Coccomyxa sp. Obi]